MRFVPAAFFSNTRIRQLYRDGNNCLIYKSTDIADLDNHRLLSHHAITFVMEGALHVHTDEGLPLKVESGHLILLPKGLYAITDLIPKDASFRAMVCFFEDELSLEFISNNSVESKEKQPRQARVFSSSRALNEFANQIMSIDETVKNDQLVKLKILEMLQLIQSSNDEFGKAINALNQKPNKDLMQFMEMHFNKPLAVEDFASLTGVSVATFRRSFRDLFETSPKKWLIQKRLSLAEHLLTTEQMAITEVASHAGFNDIPHFIKSFQAVYETSPLQYAKRHFRSA